MKKKLFLLILMSIVSFNCFAKTNKWQGDHFKRYKISSTALNIGLNNYYSLYKQNTKNNLMIIDYTKPSNKKRLIIINMIQGRVLIKTYVSHAKRSGRLFAINFSNKLNSNKTSLGTYLSLNSYYGKNGLSLKLKGISKSNNNAYKRHIILHSAKYASPTILKNQSMLGRSLGCFAIPENKLKYVISKMKNGGVIYVYGINKKPGRASNLV